MSFLSIAFLAALPLAAAPILLHLIDRRRNVVIEWGAMQFLVEAAVRKTRARKLWQWLLLLLRVLAVAALVLALARPMLPGTWFRAADRTETILIVDNSMSMMRETEDGPLFQQAMEQADDELGEIPPGDFVRILAASPYPVWATAGSMRVDAGSRELVADLLRELRPTAGRSDLLAALFTSVQAQPRPTQKQRRIVLLTDGQSADWSLDDEVGWRRFRDLLGSAVVPTELDIVTVDHPAIAKSNLAVDGIESTRTLVGPGQTFTLRARIRNHGRSTAGSCRLTWTVGQDDLHASRVPGLTGGQTHEVLWKHSFSDAGTYRISCRIDADDPLPPDNRATVVVRVVDEVPVLITESAPAGAEMQQDAFFVQAALGWIDGQPLEARSVFVPTVVAPDRLAELDLARHRAVVIPNLKTLSARTARALREFVSEGGGLWIALGPRTDVDAFNQFLFDDGGGLAPLAADRIVDETTSQSGETSVPRTIDPFVKDHPATAGLADNERLDVADVSVSRRFRFVPPADDEDVSVLLSLTNGQPLVVEKYVGRGRVIVQAIPLRLQWSELARSQAFVVMVQDWLNYLTQPRATRHNLAPGEPISIELPQPGSDRSLVVRRATLRTPYGDEIELTADLAGYGVAFRSSRTILPGTYSLELGLAGEAIPFHVNRHPRESNLTGLTADENELLGEVAELGRTSTERAASGAENSEPLWPTLLMILIGLTLAELLLSGAIARERFGSDPISETTEHYTAEATAAFVGRSHAATVEGSIRQQPQGGKTVSADLLSKGD